MNDRRLKILFLSTRVPYPVRDGHARRTYNILKGLAGRHDVHLLTLSDSAGDSDPQVRSHFLGLCSHFECIPSPPKTVSLPMVGRLLRSLASTRPYTVWRHYSPAFAQRTRQLVRTGSFDIVHCDILPLAYALPRQGAVPCTLTDHDVCHVKTARIARQSSNVLFKTFSYLESAKLRAFEGRIFKKVDAGITVSEHDREQLQQLSPKASFAVIENGVDTGEFIPGPGNGSRQSLLWVGGMGYAPNREAVSYFLKHIYPAIKKQVPQVTLSVIGTGATEAIRSLAARDPSVRLTGFVEDPVPWLQEAGVFVVPLLSGSGTRLKTLEAMAAGKAIVTTTIGCEGIEGIDKKHYLVADRPRDFANSAVYLLKNNMLRAQLGRNARELAQEKYDWGVVVDKLDRLYRAMAAARRGPTGAARG